MKTIEVVVVSSYQTNCYLVPTGQGLLIFDPGDEAARIAQRVGERSVLGIILTHCHSDHIGAVNELVEKYSCPVYVGRGDEVGIVDPHLSGFDEEGCDYRVEAIPHVLGEGDILEYGNLRLRVLATAGHTPGSLCFLDEETLRLFSGDTLFRGGWGRTDFVRGSSADMRTSLARLFALPDEVRVYPGHGSSTTIGQERLRWM